MEHCEKLRRIGTPATRIQETEGMKVSPSRGRLAPLRKRPHTDRSSTTAAQLCFDRGWCWIQSWLVTILLLWSGTVPFGYRVLVEDFSETPVPSLGGPGSVLSPQLRIGTTITSNSQVTKPTKRFPESAAASDKEVTLLKPNSLHLPAKATVTTNQTHNKPSEATSKDKDTSDNTSRSQEEPSEEEEDKLGRQIF